jgi:8-oxo-dGTP pyrophosphatase MutT (NUDIX family)
MGNWKKIGSQLIYKNPWISLREDKVIRPDGKEGTYSVLSLNRPWATIIAVEDESFYLVNNFRYPIDDYSLELPQGGADEINKTHLEVAKKELLEETGLTAERWDELGIQYVDPGLSTNQVVFFLARDLTKEQSHIEGDEIISEPIKVTFEEAFKKIENGEIKQVTTALGIYLAHQFLEKS